MLLVGERSVSTILALPCSRRPESAAPLNSVWCQYPQFPATCVLLRGRSCGNVHVFPVCQRISSVGPARNVRVSASLFVHHTRSHESFLFSHQSLHLCTIENVWIIKPARRILTSEYGLRRCLVRWSPPTLHTMLLGRPVPNPIVTSRTTADGLKPLPPSPASSLKATVRPANAK